MSREVYGFIMAFNGFGFAIGLHMALTGQFPFIRRGPPATRTGEDK